MPLWMQCGSVQMSYRLWSNLRPVLQTRMGEIQVQKSSKNRTNPQQGHLPSLIRVFAMRFIGKQGHKASSYDRIAESNQTELGAHAISVLSCTGSHITVVMYFHNNSLRACVETNRIKSSCFEAMSNEKCYIY